MKFPITTQTQIRAKFWEEHPEFECVPAKHQNDYPAHVRVTFCDFIEYLQRGGRISYALAQRATL